MGKKNIYLIQPDVYRVRLRFKSAYLPYATGQLWAHASQNQAVAQGYELREFVFLFESISAVVARMEVPFLAAFSCYVWNTEYNKKLARAIKEKFPTCLILFGGQNIPPNSSFLEQFPYMDYLTQGEGEIPFERLLLELLEEKPDLTKVPGLHYRLPNGQLAQNKPEALLSLEDLPSPYTTGVFDEIMARYPEIQWSCCVETNRGCPYHCSYCSWGAMNTKLRLLSDERVLAEFEWIGVHKIEFVMFVDSNYGIYERDERFVDALIEQKKKSGYPLFSGISYAKQSTDRVYRIVCKLSENKLCQSGATISFQTLTPPALRAIHRENLDLPYFKRLMYLYNEVKIPTYSELILGLPGETFDSFCAGVGTLLEMGQHDGLMIYPFILLPNAEFASSEMRDLYGIRAERFVLNMGGKEKVPPAVEDVTEYYDLVTATNTMTEEELTKAYLFGVLLQGLHVFALTRWIAVYLRYACGIRYEQFYLRMLNYALANPDSVLGRLIADLAQFRDESKKEESDCTLNLPYEAGKNVQEILYLFGGASFRLHQFYEEIEPFVKELARDETLAAELVRYQRETIRQPDAPLKLLEFAYDFPRYFREVLEDQAALLAEERVLLRFEDNENPTDWPAYGFEVVFRSVRNCKSLYTITYMGDRC
ncbi:MAG: radical SAM protein [Desulfovibrionaceae bacterium]|nr:radical SAM protein [Desulfovibrionaceae bacterium]